MLIPGFGTEAQNPPSPHAAPRFVSRAQPPFAVRTTKYERRTQTLKSYLTRILVLVRRSSFVLRTSTSSLQSRRGDALDELLLGQEVDDDNRQDRECRRRHQLLRLVG